MRIEVHSVNGGEFFLAQNHPNEWVEFIEMIAEVPYHVQLCRQKGRETEMIFSPSMANAELKKRLVDKNWSANVPIANPSYHSGKDVDFYKNGVVLEVQFAHYGLMQADVGRMEELRTGGLALAGGFPVDCGIELVVTNRMPRSQSVAHLGQALTRAAPLARTLPLILVGITPPRPGEKVILHEVEERSRKSKALREVDWE